MTLAELYRAVRELAGPEVHVGVSIVPTHGDTARTRQRVEWEAYLPADSDPAGEGFVFDGERPDDILFDVRQWAEAQKVRPPSNPMTPEEVQIA